MTWLAATPFMLALTDLTPVPPTPPLIGTGAGTGIVPVDLSPVAQTIIRSASAKGNPALWISDADDPTRALREERAGTSGIRWEIGAAGRVENCTVASSSGSPDLDRAACHAITGRGRYEPALDASGAPPSARRRRAASCGAFRPTDGYGKLIVTRA